MAIYVKDDIHFKLREDLAIFTEGEFESIFKIKRMNKDVILGTDLRLFKT